MWKPLALASLLSLPAAAQDLGDPVVFPSAPVLAFQTRPGSPSFQSGESRDIPRPWDAIVFQGASDDPGVRFEARRRLPDGSWGPWTAAAVKRFPGGRFWARVRLSPLGPGTVELRAAGGRAAPVEIYGIDAFESSDVEAHGGVAASTAPARAPAHARAEWGAKPPKEPYTPHDPVRLTFHHTAGRRTRTLQESLDEVRFIQDFHQNGRGWIDIGYHFLIDSEGRVFQGRPESVAGAHVRGNNTGNVGVSLMAYHHDPKNDAVTPAELDALKSLLRALALDYAVPASELRGHRDWGSGTECPGDLAYEKKAELQDALRRPTPPNPALSGAQPGLPGRLPR